MPNGFGFRGSSPPWPYVGLGRGGLPRCWYFLRGMGAPASSGYGQAAYPHYAGAWGVPYGSAATPGAVPFAPQMTKEQELDFLRNQAEVIGEQLEDIENRIRKLSSEK
ncbi:MAG: DUF5320 domain-containing protein [Dehalococcoidia bacterium]